MFEYVRQESDGRARSMVSEKKTVAHTMHSFAVPPIQMFRKRVKGVPDTFSADDIYFDKNDGDYYKDMTKEGTAEVEVSSGEYRSYQALMSKDRTLNKGGLAEAKKSRSEGITYIRNLEAPHEDADRHIITGQADIFTEGTKMAVPPKTVRLYAEGDMAHALALSEAFHDVRKYDQFLNLGEDEPIAASEGQPEVLIKATEFDAWDGVKKRYASGLPAEVQGQISARNLDTQKELLLELYVRGFDEQKSGKRRNIKASKDCCRKIKKAIGVSDEQGELQRFCKYIYDVGYNSNSIVLNPEKEGRLEMRKQALSGAERLEASFDGPTGNLAREIGPKSMRKYDIIQATFFWLPDETNMVNFSMLKGFMENQQGKLNEGGEIRIVLTNNNSWKTQDQNLDPEQVVNDFINNQDTHHIMDQKSDYQIVAKLLSHDTDLNRIYDINLKELGKKYSENLHELDMNRTDFKHTQTKQDKEVVSTGDLIIKAKLKPAPPS